MRPSQLHHRFDREDGFDGVAMFLPSGAEGPAEQSQRLPAQASPLVGNNPGGEHRSIGRLQFRR